MDYMGYIIYPLYSIWICIGKGYNIFEYQRNAVFLQNRPLFDIIRISTRKTSRTNHFVFPQTT